jgi:hypothetical protein
MDEGFESDEFAVRVFVSLSRKRGMVPQALTKDELKDFWEQLSDQRFDSRLRTFFAMLVILVNIHQSWHGLVVCTVRYEFVILNWMKNNWSY